MMEQYAVMGNLLRAWSEYNGMTHLAHWSVRGTDFYQYHLLFERLYDDMGGLDDKFVELFMATGFVPEPKDFPQPGVDIAGSNRYPEHFVQLCRMYLSALITALQELRTYMQHPIDSGILNLLDDTMQTLTTHLYLLGATE